MICEVLSIRTHVAARGGSFDGSPMKLQLKWTVSGNKSSFFSEPKYLSKVIFHPWSAHFIIYFLFESLFCELFFKSVQWVTNKRCCCFGVFKAELDLLAGSSCRRTAQVTLVSQTLLSSKRPLSLPRHVPSSDRCGGRRNTKPNCERGRYLWLNVIFHVFSWNQLWHLPHVCSQGGWQQDWRHSTVSLPKASAAVLFGKESPGSPEWQKVCRKNRLFKRATAGLLLLYSLQTCSFVYQRTCESFSGFTNNAAISQSFALQLKCFLTRRNVYFLLKGKTQLGRQINFNNGYRKPSSNFCCTIWIVTAR